MKNYALKGGRDCDGFSSPACRKFPSEKLADKFCFEYAQSSDGSGFYLADKADAKRYCEAEEIKFPTKFY